VINLTNNKILYSTFYILKLKFTWTGHANWLFSSFTEDVSFWSVLGTLSALEALFATMRYINWPLHYITLHYWQKKGKGAYSSWNSPQNYGTPLVNGITQCYLPPDRGDRPAFTPTGQVGTRFIDPVRMKGWVGLVFDEHEASRGLFAKAELLVFNPPVKQAMQVCVITQRRYNAWFPSLRNTTHRTAPRFRRHAAGTCGECETRGQSNLTKSASRAAHSPVRGYPRGSKVVPLNSWGRVSY